MVDVIEADEIRADVLVRLCALDLDIES